MLVTQFKVASLTLQQFRRRLKIIKVRRSRRTIKLNITGEEKYNRSPIQFCLLFVTIVTFTCTRVRQIYLNLPKVIENPKISMDFIFSQR